MSNQNPEWFGLSMDFIHKHYGADVTFVASLAFKGEDFVSSVFHQPNPDRTKGHKEYFFITVQGEGAFIRGLNRAELEPLMAVDAIRCKSCDDVIFSVNRHDFRYCFCRAVAIDGGRDYTRIVGSKLDYELLSLNLLTGESKVPS